jgi:hypothetical protein
MNYLSLPTILHREPFLKDSYGFKLHNLDDLQDEYMQIVIPQERRTSIVLPYGQY